MKKPKTGSKNPQKDDCQTPNYAIDVILKYLKKFYAFGRIYESASGEGIIVKKLKKEGFRVVSGDSKNGKNFLYMQKDFCKNFFDLQLTNPPYSKKYEWLKKSYEIGVPFFLLVPVDTLGAAAAQMLFKKNGITIIFMDKRINYKMPYKGWTGSAQFSSIWLWWDGTKKHKMIFENVIRTEPE